MAISKGNTLNGLPENTEGDTKPSVSYIPFVHLPAPPLTPPPGQPSLACHTCSHNKCMSLTELKKRQSILDAVKLCDQMGRENFLRQYGFGRAKEYFLVINGKTYDSKAIAGVAHGLEFPQKGALKATDFTGGEHTVQRKLQQLGFTVRRNRDASRKASLRKTFLLTWKEDQWPHKKLLRLVNTFKAEEEVEDVWRFKSHKKAKVGDRVFIMKQGKNPRGLFGSGRITGKPFQNKNMTNKAGQHPWCVDVTFDQLVDPKKTLLVPYEELSRFYPERGLWNNQSSGIEIPEHVASKIEQHWKASNVTTSGGESWSEEEVQRDLAQFSDALFQQEVEKELVAEKSAALPPEPPGPERPPARLLSHKGKRYQRSPKKSADALLSAGYHCEIDSRHKSFTSSQTGENYVEAHHLIPLKQQEHYSFSLDVRANIVSLCPNCHRLVHHAKSEEREQLLVELLNRRKVALEEKGISIKQQNLLRTYRSGIDETD